jgi:excisionase family DNA binding protein
MKGIPITTARARAKPDRRKREPREVSGSVGAALPPSSGIGHNGGPPLQEVEPLVVGPRVAWHLLGCGNTHGYELIAAGELESYLDGRSRRITMRSIKAYIARRLAADRATSAALTDARSRGRGRPRKRADTAGAP